MMFSLAVLIGLSVSNSFIINSQLTVLNENTDTLVDEINEKLDETVSKF